MAETDPTSSTPPSGVAGFSVEIRKLRDGGRGKPAAYVLAVRNTSSAALTLAFSASGLDLAFKLPERMKLEPGVVERAEILVSSRVTQLSLSDAGTPFVVTVSDVSGVLSPQTVEASYAESSGRRRLPFLPIAGVIAAVAAVAIGVVAFTGGSDDNIEVADAGPSPVATRGLAVQATLAPAATAAAIATPRPAATATASAGSSRTNALQVGQSVNIESKWQLSVVSPANADAWPTIQAANRFNATPTATERLVLIRVKAKNVSTSQTPAKIDDFNLRLTGSGNQLYTPFDSRSRCGVIPDEFEATLFPNGEATGNVCFRIPTAETGLLLVWKPDLGNSLIYFRID